MKRRKISPYVSSKIDEVRSDRKSNRDIFPDLARVMLELFITLICVRAMLIIFTEAIRMRATSFDPNPINFRCKAGPSPHPAILCNPSLVLVLVQSAWEPSPHCSTLERQKEPGERNGTIHVRQFTQHHLASKFLLISDERQGTTIHPLSFAYDHHCCMLARYHRNH